MGFNLHAEGTNDPKDVRNWRIHMVALIASMSALASKSSPVSRSAPCTGLSLVMVRNSSS